MKLARPNVRGGFVLERALLVSLALLLGSCGPPPANNKPSIEFSTIPPAEEGGPEKRVTVAGRVVGARPGQQIVLFAWAGKWWVQPLADQPFTTIQPDSTWTSSIHLGTEYAALLVEPGYTPPPTMDVLPIEGGAVAVVKSVPGETWEQAGPKTLQFSGYEWQVRSVPSNRGGRTNNYDSANAWTDAGGFLHLRIAQNAGQWTCAEVKLSRSLGYGSYLFVVRDISHLEPAVVLSMFTWDDSDAGQNHREMNIELSKWGDAGNKNAQYVVQPFYVPANVVRFSAPPGALTHSFRWEAEKVAFRTVRGVVATSGSSVVDEHTFASGVPSPGGESIHLDLYLFGNEKNPLKKDSEVVIEKFQYLP